MNSPTWSPDGQYIFARRHFVKERSLGAGEIWMYHASGGEGLQVTEKNGWQKDAGEPAVSPDGRYLYYSKDVTPGPDRSSTTRIRTAPSTRSSGAISRPARERTIAVAARRLDHAARVARRQVARLRPPRAPEDRAVRARPRDRARAAGLGSPRQGPAGSLGHARRLPAVRLDARRPVARAVGAGPDLARRRGDAGRRRRSRSARTSSRRINEALRFPQEVHPPRFPVRMLRDVMTSPDGKRVAYSALGAHLRQGLPDGEPTRAHAAATRVRVRSRVLVRRPRRSCTRPGPTRTAAASASCHAGRRHGARRRDDARALHRAVVLARRQARSSIAPSPATCFADRAYGAEPGHLRRRRRRRAPPRLVREGGIEPQFDHTGKRLYFRDRRERQVRAGERASCRAARRAGPLPVRQRDADRAVARRQVGRVRRALSRVRRGLSALGPPDRSRSEMTAIPVARISRDAGLYLHWSGDSRRVLLGARAGALHARSVAHVHVPRRRAREGRRARSEGRPDRLHGRSDVPSGAVAFDGRAHRHDGRRCGAERQRHDRCHRERHHRHRGQPHHGHRAGGHGDGARRARRGSTRAGKTIMPGIVDVHAHVGGERRRHSRADELVARSPTSRSA